ncbi:MAG: hypothetical protein ACE5K0_05310 [Candidatus Methanofastidiosia archaeon]
MNRREFLKFFGLLGILGSAGCLEFLREEKEYLELKVDASKTLGKVDSSLWANIGYDPIYSGTVGEGFRDAWKIIGESKALRYVRCHNMFSDKHPEHEEEKTYGCRVYSEDENGKPVYNWKYLDEVLNTFVSAGVKPILECDFMPDALAEGKIVRNYSGGAINTPKDYVKWRNLVFETLRHCEDRYGTEEVRTWYFEIWNEPDLKTYFIDAPNWRRFLRMYDYFVDGAISADPHVKVGGPGIAGHEDFLKAFLDHCVNGINSVTGERGTRIDFVSWHGYGSIADMLEKDRRAIEIAKGFGLEIELSQNEWGQSLRKDRNPKRQKSFFTEYEACFLTKMIAGVYERIPELSKFLRWGKVTSVGGKGWRTLSTNLKGEIVKFPIFLCYEMLSKLSEERIEFSGTTFDEDVFGIATKNKNSLKVLVYNFEEENYEGFGDATQINLRISNTFFEKAILKHYRIDKNHSNPYRHWLELSSPRDMTSEEIEILKEKGNLEVIESREVEVENKEILLSFELPKNAVSLLSLEVV